MMTNTAPAIACAAKRFSVKTLSDRWAGAKVPERTVLLALLIRDQLREMGLWEAA